MESANINSDDAIPELIGKNIKIESIIGRGGMGTVYRGKHLTLDRDVAIKIINPESAQKEEVNKRFEQEARLMAKLRHPNAALVYDFGTLPDGRLFIVMEYVEGETLSQVLDRVGTLSHQKAVEIAVSICKVLGEAHSLGIVHRDLKPANVILNERGVFVLDFGIAKMLRDSSSEKTKASMTAAGTLIGTPHYMSPEQCLGEKLDGRSDLYSLGALLYEMISGRPPFDDEVVSAVIIKHATAEVSPLQEVAESVSPKLAQAVNHLLQKKPEDRPANAVEARKLLEESLSDEKSFAAAPLKQAQPQISKEAPTEKLNQPTMPVVGETLSESDSKSVSSKGLNIAAIAVIGLLLAVIAVGGGYWFAGTYLGKDVEVAKNTSENKDGKENSKTGKDDPYAKDYDSQMDHSKHTANEDDYVVKGKETDNEGNSRSAPLLSSEEADEVITFITNTTYHRADGMQIIKTPKDTALVCLHNMIEQGSTHLFVVERPNINSKWQVSARVSLDNKDFKSPNWKFEPEDVDEDGFEEVIFTALNPDETKRRTVIYSPRTRQSYWLLATNLKEGGEPLTKFSPNAETSKAEAFRKRLLESVKANSNGLKS